VARVHRLQHVERLTAADLADDDPIRAHPKRVADEMTDRDLPTSLHVRRTGFQRDHVRLREPELGGVFDRDQALLVGDETRQHAEECGLAAPGAAADHDVGATPDAGREEPERPGADAAGAQEIPRFDRDLGEPADRQDGTAERERRNDRMDPGATTYRTSGSVPLVLAQR
jgi:hypothetical protein